MPQSAPAPVRTTASPLRQFLRLAGIVLVLGMLCTGLWVSARIERGVAQNAGAATALYVDAMISPVAQDLDPRAKEGSTAGGDGTISPAARAALDRLVRQGALSQQISAFKLWNSAHRVVYSSRPEMEGQVAPDNPRLARALAGGVSAALRKVPALSNRPGGAPRELMEVYSPVHSSRDGTVIGVAEFYTSSETLRADLFDASLKSWLASGAISLAMFLALYSIFARGERTIRAQRAALDAKIAELSQSLTQNAALTRQVDQANLRSAEINEIALRRLSADLHDGPAQHLAFAALRLDGAPGQAQVAQAVDQALAELRLICRGLVLPELADLDVAAVLERVVGAHEARNGQRVALHLAPDLPPMPLAARNCIYRAVQEALNNAARHAPGAQVSVRARAQEAGVTIEITDDGPGFAPGAATAGLGLDGLRARVTGLKGRFALHSAPGRGTSLRLWLPCCAESDSMDTGATGGKAHDPGADHRRSSDLSARPCPVACRGRGSERLR